MKTLAKGNIVDVVGGLFNLGLTIHWLNIEVGIPKIFISVALISFGIGILRQRHSDFLLSMIRINAGFSLFVLLGMNVWIFLTIPVAAFGFSALGIIIRNKEINMAIRSTIFISSLILGIYAYVIFIPKVIDLLADTSLPNSDGIMTDYSLIGMDNSEIKAEQLKGKVVVIDFWATWCRPCIQEFKEMKTVFDKYQDDPEVVFLFSSQEDWEVIKKYAEESEYNFPFVYDIDGKVFRSFKVKVMPTILILNKMSTVKYMHKGYTKGGNFKNKLIAEIEYLKQNNPG